MVTVQVALICALELHKVRSFGIGPLHSAEISSMQYLRGKAPAPAWVLFMLQFHPHHAVLLENLSSLAMHFGLEIYLRGQK